LQFVVAGCLQRACRGDCWSGGGCCGAKRARRFWSRSRNAAIHTSSCRILVSIDSAVQREVRGWAEPAQQPRSLPGALGTAAPRKRHAWRADAPATDPCQSHGPFRPRRKSYAPMARVAVPGPPPTVLPAPALPPQRLHSHRLRRPRCCPLRHMGTEWSEALSRTTHEFWLSVLPLRRGLSTGQSCTPPPASPGASSWFRSQDARNSAVTRRNLQLRYVEAYPVPPVSGESICW
jgi:hypothetical protein